MPTVQIGSLMLDVKPVLLCSVVEADVEATIRGVEDSIAAGADCIELRIDKLTSNELVPVVIQRVGAPKLVVCRPADLDGFFVGAEEERIERLLLGIASGADAVDIELTTEPALRQKVISAAKEKQIPLLICYENFEETPSKEKLLAILQEEVALGADIAKFAVRANRFEDLLTVLETVLVAKKLLTVPFVAIAMGKFGSISRPLACVMGSAMTYCAREKGKEGAPGQLPVKETRDIIDLLS